MYKQKVKLPAFLVGLTTQNKSFTQLKIYTALCITFTLITFLVSIKHSFHQDARGFSLQNIYCNGNETTLSDCNITTYDLIECTKLAAVICEGVFSLLTIYSTCCDCMSSITAPCLSNGITDCSKCMSQEDCRPIPDAQCNCTSDCYSSGTCCPDVGYLQNCFGNIWKEAQIIILLYTLFIFIRWGVYDRRYTSSRRCN